MKLKRICLVSGGNRGICFETCYQLAKLGHTVILTARNLTKSKIDRIKGVSDL